MIHHTGRIARSERQFISARSPRFAWSSRRLAICLARRRLALRRARHRFVATAADMGLGVESRTRTGVYCYILICQVGRICYFEARISKSWRGAGTVAVDRRRLLQVAFGGGALAALVLPDRWVRPVVKSVIVPAHAQASPATTTTTTAAPTTAAPTTTGSPTTTASPTTSTPAPTTSAAPTTTPAPTTTVATTTTPVPR